MLAVVLGCWVLAVVLVGCWGAGCRQGAGRGAEVLARLLGYWWGCWGAGC